MFIQTLITLSLKKVDFYYLFTCLLKVRTKKKHIILEQIFILELVLIITTELLNLETLQKHTKTTLAPTNQNFWCYV